MSADVGIVILAGGSATRLPNKLELAIGDEPLLVRVYRALRGRWPVYIAGNANLSDSIDMLLDCPVLVDRWPKHGPLAALLSAATMISHQSIVAVAGDLPFMTRETIEALLSEKGETDDAVVAVRNGRMEPLVAVYDRVALVREGLPLIRSGDASMHALLDRLNVKRVEIAPAILLNVNTPADLELAHAAHSKGPQ